MNNKERIINEEIRMRKPSSENLNLEKYFSYILKNISKLVDILHSKSTTEDEEKIAKYNIEFMGSSLKIIQIQSEMNTKISSHMYYLISSHPETEKIFLEIKNHGNSLSRALTFILSAFSQPTLPENILNKLKRKQNIILQCLENISKKEKEISNYVVNGKRLTKPLWVNTEKPVIDKNIVENKFHTVNENMIGKSRLKEGIISPRKQESSTTNQPSTEKKKDEFIKMMNMANKIIKSMEDRLYLEEKRTSNKLTSISVPQSSNIFTTALPTFVDFLDTKLKPQLNKIGLNWAFSRLKDRAFQLTKIGNRVSNENTNLSNKKTDKVKIDEEYLIETAFIIKNLQEDIWWIIKLQEINSANSPNVSSKSQSSYDAIISPRDKQDTINVKEKTSFLIEKKEDKFEIEFIEQDPKDNKLTKEKSINGLLNEFHYQDIEDTVSIFSEKEFERRKTMRLENSYVDVPLELMIQTFEKNCYNSISKINTSKNKSDKLNILKRLAEKASGLQMLESFEQYLDETIDFNIAQQCKREIKRAFDQYTGLKQMSDFRSVTPIASVVHKYGIVKLDPLMKSMIISTLEVLFLKETSEVKILSQIIEVSNYLVDQYSKLKESLLDCSGYISSFKEVSGFESMNVIMGREYINEVLIICNDAIQSYGSQFNERLEKMRVLNENERRDVFFQLGLNEKDFDVKLRNHLKAIKPWAKTSINLHIKSILQREVFGRNRVAILKFLQESKKKMVDGFRLIVQNFIPEPIFHLEKLLNDFDNAIKSVLKKGDVNRETFLTFHNLFRAKKKLSRETISHMQIDPNEIQFLNQDLDDDN
eukprot:TRINITY_DN7854_c0_g1_i1.p1 TRINITY_DN7854_c0_g1~~TRINITY_DN7854_c0_g1_i1.p1  ORF type:complete len:819 (-),score=215.97 TRINITY_DN7854_c0_g1_i1:25-2481(-)